MKENIRKKKKKIIDNASFKKIKIKDVFHVCSSLVLFSLIEIIITQIHMFDVDCFYVDLII